MAWGTFAAGPSRRYGVVTPTGDADGSGRALMWFENKDPRAVFRRGTDRLATPETCPNPRAPAEQRT